MNLINIFKKKIKLYLMNINENKSEDTFLVKGKVTYKCHMTPNHPIANYLKLYKLYDRFLPSLVKNSGSGFIDIGSNIGDTLLMVKSLSDVDVVCVEPDQFFTSILNRNIFENDIQSVIVFPHAISNHKRLVDMQKNHLSSTGNLVDSDNGEMTFTMTEMIDILKLDLNRFHTLKIDTDGFDWEILESLKNYYSNEVDSKKFKFIYFELQFYLNSLGFKDQDMEWRIMQFINVLSDLKLFGYNEIYLFDNFGTYMFKTRNTDDVLNIVNYIKRSQTLNNASTLWFCDILLCNNNDSIIVEQSLEHYINSELEII